MECFESLDDAKKKISADLSSNNPQYQVIPFTSSTRPSDNKLWERMGQVVVKATGQWVCFDVPVQLDRKARTKRMYAVAYMKPTCFTIYVYNSRDGPGFHDVIQTALDIGFASKTPLLADDLLQSRQTIKRRTMDRFKKGIVKLQGIAHNHFINNGRASFSIDIWMDNATQTAYSADTMHLIDVNFIMHARIVSCDEFSEGTSHTAAAIHRDFLNSVRPFITWKEKNVMVQAAD
ncbi:unnamed protein product [Sphagnum troendelagicum]|uniref:Uncharacterized protein n=1 Tax=Sphagnum troendelagicum TaxID=128251 RepID=A0ABP0V2Z8_9BRYO